MVDSADKTNTSTHDTIAGNVTPAGVNKTPGNNPPVLQTTGKSTTGVGAGKSPEAEKKDEKQTSGSGRSVNTNDHPEELNSPIDDNAPIGTVADALDSPVDTIEAPKEDASEKKRDENDSQPILSLAALRDYHNARGTAPSTEQVNEVRELENKILEEGGKKHRVNEH